MCIRDSCERLQGERDALEKECERLKSLQLKPAGDEDNLVDIESDREELERQLSDRLKILESDNFDKEQQIAKLKDDLEQLSKEKPVEQPLREAKSTVDPELKQKYDKLRLRYGELEDKRGELEQELENLLKENEKFKDNLQVKDEEVQILREELNKHREMAVTAAYEKVYKEMGVGAEKEVKPKGDVEELEDEEVKELVKMNKALQDENDKLKEDVKELESECNRLDYLLNEKGKKPDDYAVGDDGVQLSLIHISEPTRPY
eukprot:TRINITY_DN15349_c0_g1_i1.p1 TRINITY_DN15349_c0_g1~~TRINITY_DN15349_c0_g1_i1.p1  ORF type:complete len:262 (-),score=100.70 TRINITY_DN15349_c0_g1_i1:36-821(-)